MNPTPATVDSGTLFLAVEALRTTEGRTGISSIRLQHLLGVFDRRIRQFGPTDHARQLLRAFFNVELPHRSLRPAP